MPLFDHEALHPGVSRREVAAWAGYDFANSGYTTVVLTTVYSQFFVGVVAAQTAYPTSVWTWVLAISNALVLLLSPLVGAYADLRAKKKGLLLVSTIGWHLHVKVPAGDVSRREREIFNRTREPPDKEPGDECSHKQHSKR